MEDGRPFTTCNPGLLPRVSESQRRAVASEPGEPGSLGPPRLRSAARWVRDGVAEGRNLSVEENKRTREDLREIPIT